MAQSTEDVQFYIVFLSEQLNTQRYYEILETLHTVLKPVTVVACMKDHPPQYPIVFALIEPQTSNPIWNKYKEPYTVVNKTTRIK